MSIRGKVAVVTGDSRGIALQLGEAGAKVYINGRDPKNKKPDPVFSTLEQTAKGMHMCFFTKSKANKYLG
uniref:Short-chain dehydrogenase n=1 Tax=Acrobeloides nanus TaxID=290746 RepID=A0A914EHV8_9BILA